jgi:hypothetical protein
VLLVSLRYNLWCVPSNHHHILLELNMMTYILLHLECFLTFNLMFDDLSLLPRVVLGLEGSLAILDLLLYLGRLLGLLLLLQLSLSVLLRLRHKLLQLHLFLFLAASCSLLFSHRIEVCINNRIFV